MYTQRQMAFTSMASICSSYNPLPRTAGKIQYKDKRKPTNCILPEVWGSELQLICTPCYGNRANHAFELVGKWRMWSLEESIWSLTESKKHRSNLSTLLVLVQRQSQHPLSLSVTFTLKTTTSFLGNIRFYPPCAGFITSKMLSVAIAMEYMDKYSTLCIPTFIALGCTCTHKMKEFVACAGRELTLDSIRYYGSDASRLRC